MCGACRAYQQVVVNGLTDWHNIFSTSLKPIMNTIDPRRNEPTEQGRDNDPSRRDDSAFQPGISTVSNSDYDEANEELTKTASEDFREDESSGPSPDRSFDEVDYD
jgi:hypothetical protein